MEWGRTVKREWNAPISLSLTRRRSSMQPISEFQAEEDETDPNPSEQAIPWLFPSRLDRKFFADEKVNRSRDCIKRIPPFTHGRFPHSPSRRRSAASCRRPIGAAPCSRPGSRKKTTRWKSPTPPRCRWNWTSKTWSRKWCRRVSRSFLSSFRSLSPLPAFRVSLEFPSGQEELAAEA